MRKTLAATIVALVAIAVGTLSFGLATASPHSTQGKKLEAIEPFEFATETDTDLGDPGLSQGDLSTFHFDVYDPSGTVQLGYETSQCVVGSVNEGIFTFDCSSDFVLTGGQIETEGTLEGSVSGGPRGLLTRDRQTELTEHFAITGGTAKYRGARGQLDWGGNDPDAIIL